MPWLASPCPLGIAMSADEKYIRTAPRRLHGHATYDMHLGRCDAPTSGVALLCSQTLLERRVSDREVLKTQMMHVLCTDASCASAHWTCLLRSLITSGVLLPHANRYSSGARHCRRPQRSTDIDSQLHSEYALLGNLGRSVLVVFHHSTESLLAQNQAQSHTAVACVHGGEEHVKDI